LRSETSLIQTIGRAARNVGGQVIMYADRITGSMERAIDEGILCPYYYFPKIVSLTPDEMVHYAEISTKLAKAYITFLSPNFILQNYALSA